MSAIEDNADCEDCGLARFFDIAGGITPNAAVKRAKSNLRVIRKEILDEVDAALEQIGLLLLSASAAPAMRPYDEVRSAANTIHGVSGAFGLEPLGVAAFMLREYLEHLRTAGRWDAEGLQLYHDAMRCLRGDANTPHCREVLVGLQQLASHSLRVRPSPPLN